jgi:hypothetical protein
MTDSCEKLTSNGRVVEVSYWSFEIQMLRVSKFLYSNVYRISSYSFRGNYSFLNLTLCNTVSFGDSAYKCGNYSREETIQGQKLYEEIR